MTLRYLLLIALGLSFASHSESVWAQSVSQLITQGAAECPTGSDRYCPDTDGFRDVARTWGNLVAPSLPSLAPSAGHRALAATLMLRTGFAISQDSQWARSGGPTSVLAVGVGVGKGLPFGGHLSASFSRLTSARTDFAGWTLGSTLRWSLLEGRLPETQGALPDVAVFAGLNVASGIGLTSWSARAGTVLSWRLVRPKVTWIPSLAFAVSHTRMLSIAVPLGDGRCDGCPSVFPAQNVIHGVSSVSLSLHYRVFRFGSTVELRFPGQGLLAWSCQVGMHY